LNEITEPLTPFGLSAAALAARQQRYNNDRTGPLSSNLIECGAYLTTDASAAAPDVEIAMVPSFISLESPELMPPDRHGLTLSCFATRPASRGTVTIASDDPLDRPIIDPRYLSEPGDRALALTYIERARDIVARPAFDRVRGREIVPGADRASRDDLIAAIRATASTTFHPVGSCKMGVDDMAVVDPQLRVRGLEGLCVADASVMPTVNTGHTNAPAIMIAEKASDLLLAGR
jgi:choline dehydrogenase